MNNMFLKTINKIFLIDEINIDIDSHELKQIISSELVFLQTQNILFIKQQKLINKLKNLDFLENIIIKKDILRR